MRLAVPAVVLVLTSGLVTVRAQDRAAWKHENTPQNLQSLMETVHRKLHVDKAPAEGAALFRALVPDEARAKRALRDGLAAAVVTKVVQNLSSIAGAPDAEFGQLMKPQQSVVRVRGATTEEIAAYREASIPFEHFPSAAQQVAKELLRPGVTFYEVEFLEPGQPRGIKYHLFYWDGRRWAMLGQVWRGIR